MPRPASCSGAVRKNPCPAQPSAGTSCQRHKYPFSERLSEKKGADRLSALLDELREAVGSEPLRSKVLIAENRLVGHAMLDELAAGGTTWVNVHVETCVTLAQSAAKPSLLRSGTSYADVLRTRLLLTELMPTVQEVHSYLPGTEISSGTARSFHAAIMELRAEGIDPAAFPFGSFLDARRGAALAALLTAYTQRLATLHLADDADILRLARGMLGPETLLLVPSSLLIHGALAKDLLRSVPQGCVKLLDDDLPTGAELPANAATRVLQAPDVARVAAAPFGSLLAPTNEPSPLLELGAPVDAAHEVAAALRTIVDRGWSLDSAQLLLAREAPYADLLREASQRSDISMTFAFGVPVASTRPGRAAMAYLEWFSRGLPARQLADAFANGLLTLSDDEGPLAPPPHRVSRILRSANIGWERDRYLPALHLLRDSLDAGSPEATERAKSELDLVTEAIQRLLGRLPAVDEGRCSVRDLAAGLLDFLMQFSAPKSLRDAEAKAVLLALMRSLTKWATVRQSADIATQELLREITDLRVGTSGPQPGHLHCALLQAGRPVGREHVFVLGLDEASYPSPTVDPLLLDQERSAMTPPLLSSAEGARERLFAQARAFSGIRGTLACSFARREAGAARSSFPSPFMLQALRLRRGEPSATYGDLEKHLEASGAIFPSPSFGSDAAWLRRILRGPVPLEARSQLKTALPHLVRGDRLLSARASSDLTAYDGKIAADPDRLDPRRTGTAVSASRLETMGACPLKYFFRYVLGVRPLDEVELDLSAWLNPKERGTLLHTIYQDFYQGLGRPASGTSDEESLLMRVVEARLAEWRDRVPPPSQAVSDRERTEIVAAARAFLEMEVSQTDARPVLFELAFGENGGDQEPAREPISIALPGGDSLRVTGVIDRLDDAGGHRYHVWDYKTGSPPRGRGTLMRGRRIQHALYRVAAEEILRQSGVDPQPTVVRSGYRYPTRRGRLRIWLPEAPDPSTRLAELLQLLLDAMANGTFLAAEDADHCGICDFRAACGGEATAKAAGRKFDVGNAELDALREVAGIE